MRKLAVGLQVVLGLVYLMSAVPKLVGAQDAMREHLGVAPWFWVVTGLVELAGALGMLAGIKHPRLATPAGLWLSALMVGAIFTHLRADDPLANAVPAAVLLVLALAVAVLRSDEHEVIRRMFGRRSDVSSSSERGEV